MVEISPSASTLRNVVRRVLEEGRDAEVFPSASVWVADDLRPLLQEHVGDASQEAIWDLASLTKPMATVSLAMRLQAEGALRLDDRPSGSKATLRQLLGHRSGLPAWWDLRAVLDRQEPGWKVGSPAVKATIRRAILDCLDGRDHRACYSDLGFMLLGWHMEEVTGASLDQLVPGFGVDPNARMHCMSGGLCGDRQRELIGEVNDLNTFVLGGVAGHAGLFGRAEDVGLWALDLLRSYRGLDGSFEPDIVRSYWSSDHFDDTDTWVLGFDTPTPGGSSAGSLIGSSAVGHLGFTGTSVWIDPVPGRIVVLLTNRVASPPPAEAAIKKFRPRFHDAVFGALNTP